MAVANVSTYAIFQSTLDNVSSVENSLTNEQEQLSSGNAYQNFADMGSQTQQYLSLSDNISQMTQYLADHQTIEATVNTTSTVVSQIITVAENLESLISQRATGVASQGFSSQVNSTWQELTGQLNTQLGGQYLFSGSATTTAPIANTFPTLQQSGVPDDGYYQGNSANLTTSVDSNTSVTYNVNAGQLPFQQLFAGLAMAQQGDASNNSDDLQQAETLVQTSIQGMTSIQATIGATAQQLSASDTDLNNQVLYYKGLQESIGNTDIVSVSTQVSVNQSVLQAAFEAFAKITSLQLSNYLK